MDSKLHQEVNGGMDDRVVQADERRTAKSDNGRRKSIRKRDSVLSADFGARCRKRRKSSNPYHVTENQDE